jgi:hypothetical protein
MTREVIILGHGGAMGLELVGTCEVLQLANSSHPSTANYGLVPRA